MDLIFDEKVREDAVRDLGLQVVRWIWPTFIAPASFGTGCSERSPERPDATCTTYWHVALAATDATCQYVMRSGAARHMARASYTSTLPPEPRTGHPFAFVAASSRDSALMIE